MPLHPANNQPNVMHKIVLMQEKMKTQQMAEEAKKQQGLVKQAATKSQMHQKKSESLEQRVEELEAELDQLKTQFDPEYAWQKSDVKKRVSKDRRAQTKTVKTAKRKKLPPSGKPLSPAAASTKGSASSKRGVRNQPTSRRPSGARPSAQPKSR